MLPVFDQVDFSTFQNNTQSLEGSGVAAASGPKKPFVKYPYFFLPFALTYSLHKMPTQRSYLFLKYHTLEWAEDETAERDEQSKREDGGASDQEFVAGKKDGAERMEKLKINFTLYSINHSFV